MVLATQRPPRRRALQATAFLIDFLKTHAPFWKKESFTDGGERWVDARASDQAAAQRWATLAPAGPPTP